MRNRIWNYSRLAILTLLLCFSFSTMAKAALYEVALEQISPQPISYTYATDFNIFTPYFPGETTALLQYVEGIGVGSDFDDFIPGRIALVERGTTTFFNKVTSALAAGASGILVYNNVDGLVNGTTSQLVELPAFFITDTLGENLKQSLLDGNDVTMHMQFTPVPEPSSLLLLGVGLAGAGIIRRRMKK